MTARLAKEAADKAVARAASPDDDKRQEVVAAAVGLAQTTETLTVPAEPVLLADHSTPETVTSLMQSRAVGCP
ncbi:hypothetical protein [Streptomyces sp. NPDC003514]